METVDKGSKTVDRDPPQNFATLTKVLNPQKFPANGLPYGLNELAGWTILCTTRRRPHRQDLSLLFLTRALRMNLGSRYEYIHYAPPSFGRHPIWKSKP